MKYETLKLLNDLGRPVYENKVASKVGVELPSLELEDLIEKGFLEKKEIMEGAEFLGLEITKKGIKELEKLDKQIKDKPEPAEDPQRAEFRRLQDKIKKDTATKKEIEEATILLIKNFFI